MEVLSQPSTWMGVDVLPYLVSSHGSVVLSSQKIQPYKILVPSSSLQYSVQKLTCTTSVLLFNLQRFHLLLLKKKSDSMVMHIAMHNYTFATRYITR